MRSSGILMHISSLPSPYGIGTMGREARAFAEFLAAAGQTYWQILPICPTSFGDSPYQSFSTYAGNPYFIDPEDLERDGLLRPEEYQNQDWGDPGRVDYGL
ncbi:MAG: 4-alpha-glucanotransferase, partial [Oscillospiraceae bacterium]